MPAPSYEENVEAIEYSSKLYFRLWKQKICTHRLYLYHERAFIGDMEAQVGTLLPVEPLYRACTGNALYKACYCPVGTRGSPNPVLNLCECTPSHGVLAEPSSV